MASSFLLVVMVCAAFCSLEFRSAESGYCQKGRTCYRQRKKEVCTTNWIGLTTCHTAYEQEGYTCYIQVCCDGYIGQRCDQALCFGSTSCPNNGECRSPNNCVCASGFTGPTCNDKNECDISNGGCQHVCINTHGSYHCRCHDGYQLDYNRRTCRDEDECRTNNGGCQHVCTNIPGSYQCSCNAHYVLDTNERTCTSTNQCVTDNHGCQHICRITNSSFICDCRVGYKLQKDGKSCEDINECQSSKHNCSQVCVNTEGSYQCKCEEGNILQNDTKTCLAPDSMDQNPELHLVIVVGAACGGLLLAIVGIVIAVHLCRRGNRDPGFTPNTVYYANNGTDNIAYQRDGKKDKMDVA